MNSSVLDSSLKGQKRLLISVRHPGCASWSESNLIAVGGEANVLILDAAALSSPRDTVTLEEAGKEGVVGVLVFESPSLDVPCLERDVADSLAYDVTDSSVLGVSWGPPGSGGGSACALAVCRSDNTVRVLVRGRDGLSWHQERLLSENIAAHFTNRQWRVGVPLPGPPGPPLRLRGGGRVPLGVPRDLRRDAEVEVMHNAPGERGAWRSAMVTSVSSGFALVKYDGAVALPDEWLPLPGSQTKRPKTHKRGTPLQLRGSGSLIRPVPPETCTDLAVSDVKSGARVRVRQEGAWWEAVVVGPAPGDAAGKWQVALCGYQRTLTVSAKELRRSVEWRDNIDTTGESEWVNVEADEAGAVAARAGKAPPLRIGGVWFAPAVVGDDDPPSGVGPIPTGDVRVHGDRSLVVGVEEAGRRQGRASGKGRTVGQGDSDEADTAQGRATGEGLRSGDSDGEAAPVAKRRRQGSLAVRDADMEVDDDEGEGEGGEGEPRAGRGGGRRGGRGGGRGGGRFSSGRKSAHPPTDEAWGARVELIARALGTETEDVVGTGRYMTVPRPPMVGCVNPNAFARERVRVFGLRAGLLQATCVAWSPARHVGAPAAGNGGRPEAGPDAARPAGSFIAVGSRAGVVTVVPAAHGPVGLEWGAPASCRAVQGTVMAMTWVGLHGPGGRELVLVAVGSCGTVAVLRVDGGDSAEGAAGGAGPEGLSTRLSLLSAGYLTPAVSEAGEGLTTVDAAALGGDSPALLVVAGTALGSVATWHVPVHVPATQAPCVSQAMAPVSACPVSGIALLRGPSGFVVQATALSAGPGCTHPMAAIAVRLATEGGKVALALVREGSGTNCTVAPLDEPAEVSAVKSPPMCLCRSPSGTLSAIVRDIEVTRHPSTGRGHAYLRIFRSLLSLYSVRDRGDAGQPPAAGTEEGAPAQPCRGLWWVRACLRAEPGGEDSKFALAPAIAKALRDAGPPTPAMLWALGFGFLGRRLVEGGDYSEPTCGQDVLDALLAAPGLLAGSESSDARTDAWQRAAVGLELLLQAPPHCWCVCNSMPDVERLPGPRRGPPLASLVGRVIRSLEQTAASVMELAQRDGAQVASEAAIRAVQWVAAEKARRETEGGEPVPAHLLTLAGRTESAIAQAAGPSNAGEGRPRGTCPVCGAASVSPPGPGPKGLLMTDCVHCGPLKVCPATLQVVGLAPAAACRLCNVQYVEAQAKGLPACTICGCHVAKPQLPAQAPAVGMPSVSLLACLEKWAQAGQGAGQARA